VTKEEAEALLVSYKEGSVSGSEVITRLQAREFAELGYAKVDLVRKKRQGFPEVIFGSGKTSKQIIGIANSLYETEQPVLVTRIQASAAKEFLAAFPEAQHHEEARCVTLAKKPLKHRPGSICIASGGTSDIPVAEEAAVTADFMGNRVTRIYDIGVACLNRVLDRIEDLRSASVIIVIAGMEGALPSVVAGLVDKPLIAVPTSVGYGANFGGVAALLGMLNSCGSGVTVVNIDNGFGAAFAANQITRLANQSNPSTPPNATMSAE
jgi:pyridinium-3,5-biscarboxylic acid mononucleotide synthase